MNIPLLYPLTAMEASLSQDRVCGYTVLCDRPLAVDISDDD